MAKSTEELVRLQQSLLREVRKLAEEEGTSVNQFVNVAVAEKVATLRTARFFAERAARADVPAAIELLRRFGAGKPPLPGDEIDAPEAEGDLVIADRAVQPPVDSRQAHPDARKQGANYNVSALIEPGEMPQRQGYGAATWCTTRELCATFARWSGSWCIVYVLQVTIRAAWGSRVVVIVFGDAYQSMSSMSSGLALPVALWASTPHSAEGCRAPKACSRDPWSIHSASCSVSSLRRSLRYRATGDRGCAPRSRRPWIAIG